MAQVEGIELNSAQVLEITRRFSAPRSVVFEAITQPSVFKQWWGPKGCDCSECEIDLREGGTWQTTLIGADDCETNKVGGTYQEIDTPSKLVFTWAWTQPDGSRGDETVVTIHLFDEGEKTLMEFSQAVFSDADQCQKHRYGWESACDCLDLYLLNSQ
ncbi:SRPBCC family protein [Kiloniella sp.]|uniref:SRPBCC family protein n=1 Tax=Kiloniella sp. TaxID=1938587 RepID=UPI003B02DCAE